MVKMLLIIGTGSFFGGIFRFLTSRYIHATFTLLNFPVGTLVVNVLGCFLIGLLYGLSERGQLISQEWRLFLTVGFCGGFTTFSAFAEDSFSMASHGHLAPLLLNVGLSVLAGVAAIYLGASVVRWL